MNKNENMNGADADGRLIRLQFNEAFCITTEEYDALYSRVVMSKILDGGEPLVDEIIIGLLKGGLNRYNEIKRIRSDVAMRSECE